MPTYTVDILESLEFELDSDSDGDTVKEKANPSRHTTLLVGKHSTSGRLIAGHRRARKARMDAENQLKGASQVLQSITASPSVCHSSFEELRLDCYFQSKIAKGAPPAPVDAFAMPWNVIPPMFKEFRDEKTWDGGQDTIMTEN
ncbi:hypothetical protein BDN70DRAFT_927110 [Pholiota conissans]|uniref:Uncharacterized protein n=1 Tax=Pholiota conissans TaxID=109636 RepID=A0A9P6D099_9AGAR|nr:hypothetical protein BDN70DRAFT_927110 [Pholiota conissans]